MTLFDTECVDEIDNEGELAARLSAGRNEPKDPSSIGWPQTLPFELAMRYAPVHEVCEGFGITVERWNEIKRNPVFKAELAGAMEHLRQDGMAFKARAGLQALEMLKTSWALVHDPTTPPNVRADLIKATVGWAGLDEGKKRGVAGSIGAPGGVTANGFHINIMLGNAPETKVIEGVVD